jgi:glycosyltransferase involved in cell wall biosynthesis
MKVLIIPTPEPADAVTSGIGRYVGILERHLGADVEVVHLPGAPHEEDRQFLRPAESTERRGLGRFVPSSIRLVVGYLRDTVSLAKQLRPYRNQVDLIHVNRVGCEIQTIAARLAGFRRIVATIHNAPGEDDAAQQWVRRMIERISFSCADFLISVSRDTYERWHARVGLPLRKVAIIHNGADVPSGTCELRATERARLALSENDVVFGICARLHPMKGHHVLLEAFASVCNAFDGVRLVIAGNGPEEKAIHGTITRLGLQERCTMVGYRSDPLAFIAALDVNLLPSITLESIGYSVIEAMHLGVPSIVSDVGGGKEIIRAAGGGIVVPRGDVSALSKAMTEYVTNRSGRREAGIRAASYAKANLKGQMMTQATIDVYRKALWRSLK